MVLDGEEQMLYKSNNLWMSVTHNRLAIGEDKDYGLKTVAEFRDMQAMYEFELFMWKFLGGSGNAPEDKPVLL